MQETPAPILAGVERAGPQAVTSVYQNERFFGIVWKAPPAALDRAEWTDEQGSPVDLGIPPTGDPQGGWEVEVSPATDSEGWQYGTVFNHLLFKRAGGRASQRWGDMVRRRKWRRQQAAPAAAGAAAAAAPAAARQAGAQRARGDAEAQRRAIRAFLAMVVDLLSRRQLWVLLPWDPAALVLTYRQHQEDYSRLQEQAQASARRAFCADAPPDPSPLRPDSRTLLQDVLCASMHARAAYGFAMAAGHLADAMSFIRLHTVQPLSFNAAGGASDEANSESVASLAGVQADDILMAEWRNSPQRPCHYVAIDRANQCIVLSIRGTLQVGDLLSDLNAAPMEVDLHGADGWVHPGMFAAATYVQCSSQGALAVAAAACPGWPLLVTGHSLGGGVAALLTLLLSQGGLPPGLGRLHCIALAPAAVVSAPLAEASRDLVTAIVVGSDVIPHLSFASVEALLLEVAAASPVRRTMEGLGRRITSALGNMTAAAKAEPEAPGWDAVREAATRLHRSGAQAGLGRTASMAAGEAAAAAAAAIEAAEAMWMGSAEAPGESSAGGAQLPRLSIPGLGLVEQAAAPAAVGAAEGRRGGAPAEPGGQPAPHTIPVLTLDDQGRVEGSAGTQARQQEPQQEAQQGPSGQGTAGGSDGSAPAAGPAQGQPAAAEPRDEDGGTGDSVLPMLGNGAGDTPGVLSAIAAEQDAQQAAQLAHLTAEAYLGPGPQARGDPEKLYPPGRILWVFPQDEDLGPGAPRAAPGATAAAAVEEEGAPGSEPGPAPPPREGRAQGVDAGLQAAAGLPDQPSGGGGGGLGPVVVEVDLAPFERLLLMPDMFNDHLPERILRAVQQL